MRIRIKATSPSSLSKAADKVRKLELKYIERNKKYVEELAKMGIDEAGKHLTVKGDSETPSLASGKPNVSMGDNGEMKTGIAIRGEDVAFVEFGAGIHYNTEAGTSPHPLGVELGYTIGSYGMGQGANDYWYYRDDNGDWQKSFGTEASMPLAHAGNKLRSEHTNVAKSIFRSR